MTNNYNLTPIEYTNLERIVEATMSPQGYALANQVAMVGLLAKGLVECNSAIIDPATGDIAFKATVAGHEAVTLMGGATPPAAQWSAPGATASPDSTVMRRQPYYDVQEGFKLPVNAAKRASVGGRAYPFDTMPLNGAIFIPATEARPNPKKALASTISSANKRLFDAEPRRFFKLVRATAGQRFGDIVAPADGAYIVRIEPPIAPEPVVE
jgi:hypothetical protein